MVTPCLGRYIPWGSIRVLRDYTDSVSGNLSFKTLPPSMFEEIIRNALFCLVSCSFDNLYLLLDLFLYRCHSISYFNWSRFSKDFKIAGLFINISVTFYNRLLSQVFESFSKDRNSEIRN